MKTNEFRVKEINDDKIVLEEERDKKHGNNSWYVGCSYRWKIPHKK